jgi:hypothetical protein
VDFCWFDYFLLLVIVGGRDEFRSTLHTLILTPLKTYTNLYVNLVALSSTRLKSFSIIFSLTPILSR